MMFWDSSAIVPLLLNEARTSAVEALVGEDPEQLVWCLTVVEASSSLSRREREGLERDKEETARTRLGFLADRWQEVVSLETVRPRSLRLLRSHPLRASDALQLAAALFVCDERPESLPFVCLDDRLSEAARREGFPVVPR